MYAGQHVIWKLDMQHPFRIDPVHTRFVSNGVADGLRLILAQQSKPGKSLQSLIDRLPELDEDSPAIAPGSPDATS